MFKVYSHGKDLPELWDQIIKDKHFLSREILMQLEKLNPCHQRYHLNGEKGIVLVSYQLKMNLFTFLKPASFKVPIQIIGVPLSVSSSGYEINQEALLEDLCQYVGSLKGFSLILNVDAQLNLPEGYTLPTCRLKIKWSSFEEYLEKMRSHYRYRIHKAIKKFGSVQIELLKDNCMFDEEMYELYLEVYENSREKLEKLPIDFFREFPARIFSFKIPGEILGFVQLVDRGEELIFLFGGFRHKRNQQYDLYMNMLLAIIDYGIKSGFKSIDLGQTAEETKLKLGASQYKKYMYACHSHPFINNLIKKLIGKFSYSHYPIVHKVFKEAVDEDPIGKMS